MKRFFEWRRTSDREQLKKLAGPNMFIIGISMTWDEVRDAWRRIFNRKSP